MGHASKQTLWEVFAGIHSDWRDVKTDHMQVGLNSGGITHLKYRICFPQVSGPAFPLLVRVYGDKTGVTIDNAREANMLKFVW